MYSYDEIVDKIYNARRFGKLTGFEVTKEVIRVLENPMKDIPYIHVAGTNGKGSTCSFLTSILMAEGKTVGTFVSPHLIDFEERIMVNNQYIPKEKVREYGDFLLTTSFPVELTMFDYCLAMAMMYFRDMKVDIVVLETGLGGAYDSTNAVGTPIATVITKIGFDHMAILGNTLGEIAREKAGILRPGVPFITQTQDEEAMAALLKAVENAKAEPVLVVSQKEMDEVEVMKPQLIGAFQNENGAGAVLCARQLGISEESIRTGVKNAKWMGRMEVICESPFVMVDGAHNGNGVHALSTSLQKLYPNEKFHFVMGVMADKDYEKMIDELLPLAEDFITVTPESSRALQAQDLAVCIQKKGVEARAVFKIEEALEKIGGEGKTIIFGSLYFVGEVEAYWKNFRL